MSKGNKVYLIDGSGYIFRAFYAVQHLTNSRGFPTNALFGFTRMLLKLMNQAGSEHVVIAFDAGRETFRNEMYKEYKANRTECPEDLLVQMPYFRQISEALGLCILELPGYEADDIIGTLAKRFSDFGVETVVVTGDKDLMQLVSDRVSIWDTMRDLRYGPAQVKEKFGVPPEQIVEFLGLTGDSSDNVPGLSGVGPKTAVQLLEKYRDIEGIIASAEAIKNDSTIRNRKQIAEQIELSPDLLRLSRRLVQLKLDTPLPIKLGEKQVQLPEINDEQLLSATLRAPPDKLKLSRLVEQLEFGTLLKELDLERIGNTDAAVRDGDEYKTIYAEDFPSWLETIKAQNGFSFDLETTSLDPLEAQIVGASFCWDEHKAFYLPLAHVQSPNTQIAFADFKACLGPVFSNSDQKKSGQNVKYDIRVLARQGIEVRGVEFDSMLASYLIDPEKSSYNLTVLARDFLDRTVIEFEDVVGEKKDFSEVDVEQATIYACQDAHFAWLLRNKLGALINTHELQKVFAEIEVPLVSVLARMENVGVKIDLHAFSALSLEFAERLEVLRGRLFELAGSEFNINSTKQLAEILFNKLGLSTKGIKKTKTGISTDSSVLEKLSSQHPLPGLILDYRLLFKLKSTYIDSLPEQVSKVTGRLHTKFNQAGTGTGRLSSSEPNLQNIPIQTHEGQRIRTAFVAEPGNVLISADYSQIELRLLAHMSADENLIESFKAGLDIHASTARQILNVPKDREITPDERRIGKTINFGLIYGMSGGRLSRELGIPVPVANKYIEDYFASFPRVQELFNKLEHEAQTKGYVTTIFGRKRFITSLDTSGRDQGFAMRVAINAPVQGSAADLIKLAMINLDTKIRSQNLSLQMILQIHDELLFECPKEFAEEASLIVRAGMESVIKLDVPLKVDIGLGQNWQEAH